MAYYTEQDLEPVRQELLAHFQFNLHSQSPALEVARTAARILKDYGMQPRRSLCFKLAREAKGAWACEIQRTHMASQR